MQSNDATTLGKYRLLAELGRGGMAKVFLAVAKGPAGFNKLVVIKQIQAQLAEDPEFVTMFLDEARLAARLNHPNVVQTNEVGQDGHRYFIAMEYLEGQTLNRVTLKLGKELSLAMQLRVLSEALNGLHHAHELCDYDGTPLGVVHRDVSPHNIFVTYSGQVKVVDFGIAKALNSSSETRTGVLKGKVAYMAPEQALGEKVDRRADLFSIGVILWQMATGKRMFRGIPDIAVIQKLLAGDIPSVREAAPDVPPALETVIGRALAPKREDRYATALELQAEVDAVADSLGDRRGLREVGRLLTERFAEERGRIQGIIEEQMRADVASSEELPLLDASPMSDSGPSSRFSSASMRGRSDSGTPSQQVSIGGTATSRASRELGTVGSLTVEGEPTMSSPRPRRTLRVAVAAGAVIAVGVGGFIAFSTQSSNGAVASASASTQTAVVRTLHIETTPTGAKVSEKGGGVLGTTPIDIPINDGAPARSFVITLEGHEPYQLEPGVLTSDLTERVPLTPVAAPRPSASTKATASASASASASAKANIAHNPPPPPPPTKTVTTTVPPVTTTDVGIRTTR